jgi:hypothetical protein
VDYSDFSKIQVDDETPQPNVTPKSDEAAEARLKVRIEKLKSQTLLHLENGNRAVRDQDWNEAESQYKAGWSLLQSWSQCQTLESQDRLKLRVRCHSNISLTYLKLNLPAKAYHHAQETIQLDPLHWKAHWRSLQSLKCLLQNPQSEAAEWAEAPWDIWNEAIESLKDLLYEHRPSELSLDSVVIEEAKMWAMHHMGLEFPGSIAEFKDMIKCFNLGRDLLRQEEWKPAIPCRLIWIKLALEVLQDKETPLELQTEELRLFEETTLEMLQSISETKMNERIVPISKLQDWVTLLWERCSINPNQAQFDKICQQLNKLLQSTLFTSASMQSQWSPTRWYAAATKCLKNQSPLQESAIHLIFRMSMYFTASAVEWDLIETIAQLVVDQTLELESGFSIVINLLRGRPESVPQSCLATLGQFLLFGASQPSLLYKLGLFAQHLCKIPQLRNEICFITAQLIQSDQISQMQVLRCVISLVLELDDGTLAEDVVRLVLTPSKRCELYEKNLDVALIGNLVLFVTKFAWTTSFKMTESEQLMEAKVLLSLLKRLNSESLPKSREKNRQLAISNLAKALATLARTSSTRFTFYYSTFCFI